MMAVVRHQRVSELRLRFRMVWSLFKPRGREPTPADLCSLTDWQQLEGGGGSQTVAHFLPLTLTQMIVKVLIRT